MQIQQITSELGRLACSAVTVGTTARITYLRLQLDNIA